jgi:uncharacterized membrane protein
MLLVPRTKLRPLPIPIEEAMKLIISAGAVTIGTDTLPKGMRGLDLDSLLKESQS